VAADDGIAFNPASVTVEEIRKEAGYGGVRVIIAGEPAKPSTRKPANASALGSWWVFIL
jgi:hypothetical protein